jgi:hypothetical protein
MPQHGGPRMNDITGTETKKRVIEDVDLVVMAAEKPARPWQWTRPGRAKRSP